MSFPQQPSPAAILRSILIDLGLVLFPGGLQQTPGDGTTWCFVSSMPDDFDQAVCIYDIKGSNQGRQMDGGRRLINPGVMVKVRSLDYSGYGLANQIAVALDEEIRNTTTMVPEDGLSHTVAAVTRMGGIVSIGEQVGKRRQQWTFSAWINFPDSEPSLG